MTFHLFWAFPFLPLLRLSFYFYVCYMHQHRYTHQANMLWRKGNDNINMNTQIYYGQCLPSNIIDQDFYWIYQPPSVRENIAIFIEIHYIKYRNSLYIVNVIVSILCASCFFIELWQQQRKKNVARGVWEKNNEMKRKKAQKVRGYTK